VPGSLVLAGSVQIVAALSFAAVARLVARRPTEGLRLAKTAFVTWWAGLGLYLGLQGVADLLAAGDRLTPAIAGGIAYVGAVAVIAAAWGLTYAVAYLYRGPTRWAAALAPYFAALAGAWVAMLAAQEPVVEVGPWWAGLAAPSGMDVIYVLVGIPALGSTVAYLSLLRHAEDALQRYRIALTGGSVLAWVGGGLVSSLMTHPFWTPFAITGLGLVTAVCVVLAFRPPAFVQAWLDDGPRAPLGGK
jgi:hypothetical protein